MSSDAKSSKKVSKANDRATNSGRYAYKAVLGEGSFGSVLKATDKSTDEDVAVKIIKAKKSVIEQSCSSRLPLPLSKEERNCSY